MKSGIYKITCTVNGKFYIGSASYLGKRKENHFASLKKNEHHNQYLQRSYNKYGALNFIFEVIEHCPKEALLEREQYWIDTLNPDFNICRIAGSAIGVKHTLQARENMSKAHIGHKAPDKTKEAVSRRHKGKILSEETKQKMHETNIARYGTGQKTVKPVCQIDSQTGEVVATYRSCVEAARCIGVPSSNIIAVCKGRAYVNKKGYLQRYISAGGYFWQYANEYGLEALK